MIKARRNRNLPKAGICPLFMLERSFYAGTEKYP
jgi:hypothetical protein